MLIMLSTSLGLECRNISRSQFRQLQQGGTSKAELHRLEESGRVEVNLLPYFSGNARGRC